MSERAEKGTSETAELGQGTPPGPAKRNIERRQGAPQLGIGDVAKRGFRLGHLRWIKARSGNGPGALWRGALPDLDRAHQAPAQPAVDRLDHSPGGHLHVERVGPGAAHDQNRAFGARGGAAAIAGLGGGGLLLPARPAQAQRVAERGQFRPDDFGPFGQDRGVGKAPLAQRRRERFGNQRAEGGRNTITLRKLMFLLNTNQALIIVSMLRVLQKNLFLEEFLSF